MLRSFSRPRASNDNPYSESLFRTVKYRPDYPRKLFASTDQACQWVAGFVDWYNHQHRHSGIKFVTPHQRHGGQALEICRYRTVVYEKGRQHSSRRWSRSIRCWHQPVVVWIIQSPDELNEPRQLRFTQVPERQTRSDTFPKSHRRRPDLAKRTPGGPPGNSAPVNTTEAASARGSRGGTTLARRCPIFPPRTIANIEIWADFQSVWGEALP